MKRKGQASIEFMILFIFVLVLISLIMYVLGFISIDLREQEGKNERDEFAQSILHEFDVATKVEGGYSRQIFFTNKTMARFNVSFNGTFLIVQDFLIHGSSSPTFYYDLPLIPYEFNKAGQYLLIEKEYVEEYDGLQIS